MIDGLNVVSNWLRSGVRFISVTQAFDFRGTIGQMVASLLFGFAELEQATRRERQRAGIEAAKARGGVYKGRQRGTTKGQPQRANELKARGLTLGEIASALSVSERTARRYLRQLAPQSS